ncbi:cadherin-89D [Neocloeon triangulifer]|uniref:cadherin-89D n=1 Tax=Neocloeon triangulifer TaxID=2078957 RepID=UPI00286EBD74|nr:cadherin-89D [Neocloeon triangulifer]
MEWTRWSVFLLVASSATIYGCQFEPAGDYLRFVRVPENVPVGGEILRVQVRPQGLLTIQPMDKEEDAQYFKVSSVNGSWVRVSLARSLEDLVDSDIPQSVLKFRLACLDPIDETVSSSYLSVTVYVEDVNDHAPHFLGTPYHVTVDELTPAGLTIFRGIHAVDRDKPNTPNSDVQYSLVSGGDEHGHFVLESSHRAALVLRSPLDFDAGDTHFNLTIVASDRGTPPNNATTVVRVTVRDNDDLSPRFTRDVYKVQIPEMPAYPAGAVVQQEVLLSPPIHAEDQDEALNASVRYEIVAGNANEIFWIDPANGSLFVRRAIDREALASERYSLALRASQKDNPARQGTARLEVTVLDVNDNAPTFEVEIYNISIVENLPNGFSVLQVAARDPDKGENGEFTYELEDPHNAFAIDPHTGWLTVKNQSQLDREKQSSLRMRVRAKEKRPSAEPGSRSAAVWVTLLDANDNNPIFQPTNVYHFQVSSDAPVGEVIGQVNALDPDLGRNGQVTYDVQRANASDEFGRLLPLPFSIEAQSGLLLVVDTPLLEDRYTLLIEAVDQPANPSERRTALAVATVDVARSRQSSSGGGSPGFVGAPYQFWVGGNAAVGTTVGLVRLKNVDKKTALYDLLHSYRTGVPFAIEERSGVITVVRDLSHFTRTHYDFETVVTDGQYTLVTNVTIHVVDPEDPVVLATTFAPPRSHLLETFEFKVRENHAGVLVGKLPVPQSKRDAQFLLVNKDLADLFAVSSDGSLYTKKGLDREERSSYHLTIISESRGGGNAKGGDGGIFQVVVVVEDENDNPPRFSHRKYSGRVSEDAAPNTLIKLDAAVHAVDVDMGNNAKFQIRLRGEGANKFHIEQESGKIFFSGKEPLDREATPRYNLRLVAVDRGNASSEADLVILVDDVNDNAPNFVQMMLLDDAVAADGNAKQRRDTVLPLKNMSSKNYPVVNLEENIAMGSPVIKIEANDVDDGDNALVTYKIVGENHREKQDRSNSARHKKERSFTINPNTGEITVAKRLSPETEFQLDVMAADCCGLSSNMSLMVNVVDVNDHAPTFKRPWYQYDLAEGTYMGWVMGWLHASDADFGNNAAVNYYIDPEEGDLPFSISPEGGALTATGTIDRETGDSYEFRVWAEDGGKPKLKTSVQVTINILDVNDNAPEFFNFNRRDDITGTPIYHTAVDENGPPGQFVLQVFANDSDYAGNGNGLLLYSIAGPPRREFHIDSKDGTITTLTSLDYESANIHNITVVASDLGSPSLSSSAIVLVAVKDHKETIVDLNPIFLERHLEVEVMENSHTPLVLTMLNVSAAYRGQALTYALLPGPDVSHFYVDSRNGTVYLMSAPDREKQSYYVIKVRAERAKKARHSVLVYPMLSDELGVSGDEVRLVVHVRDENDNTPRFEGAQEGRPIVAAIPASANYGDEVVRLHAVDADEGLNGEVRYHMLQKPDDSEPKRFDVHPITGQVRGITSFARDAGKVFGFDVRARDRRGAPDGHSVIANVIVHVLDENKQVVLVMNAKPVEVERNSQNITRALSRLTGLDVRLRKLEPHLELDSEEEADASDLYLYAVDPHLNMVVDMTRLERVLSLHSAALKRDLDIFQAMEVRDLPNSPRTPRPALLAVEAGAVAMGCFVFLGALAAAICFGCVRRKKKMCKQQKACFPGSHMGFTMNLRPPYLVELEEATTDSYVDMHSQHSGRFPRVNPDLKLSRAASSVARLQRPIASMTSISRHDSGVALHHPHNCSCSSGHETSSSNGSYEDSLKELNPSQGFVVSAEGKQQKKRQREPSSTPPPPPAAHNHHLGVQLARRHSERVVVCPLDHHPRNIHECN